MPGVEVIFFDAGETLVHPHPSFPELFATTCQEQGYREVTANAVAEAQQRLAPHLTDIAAEEIEVAVEGSSLSDREAAAFWTALYRRLLLEVGVEDDAVARALFEVFTTISSYALFDDADACLDALETSGYRLGLISNFEIWLEEMLDHLEVAHRFEVTIISGVAGVEKPDRRIYEMAVEKAGAPPETCVHVGDSIANDVLPAQALGMQTVLVDRLNRYPEHDGHRVTSLDQLPGLVEEIAG
jgi:putative hydrolase of the HAD superfamily